MNFFCKVLVKKHRNMNTHEIFISLIKGRGEASKRDTRLAN